MTVDRGRSRRGTTNRKFEGDSNCLADENDFSGIEFLSTDTLIDSLNCF